MLHTRITLLALPAVALAGTLELFSGDVRSGPSLANLKASWDTKLSAGPLTTKLSLLYELAAQKSFLNAAELSGDLPSAGEVGLSYTAKYAFKSKVAALSVVAKAMGTKLTANFDSTGDIFKGAVLAGDVGPVSLKQSYSHAGKSGALVVSTDVSPTEKDTLSFESKIASTKTLPSLEVEYKRTLEAGKTLATSYTLSGSDVALTYTDKTLEKGATWVASAVVPASAKALSDSTLKIKRAMSF